MVSGPYLGYVPAALDDLDSSPPHYYAKIHLTALEAILQL